LRVQIISSFGVDGCTPFAVGEELDVASGIAKVWIAADRARAIEAEPVTIPESTVAQTVTNTRETAVAKFKRKQTR
jgi:hypothetical protein